MKDAAQEIEIEAIAAAMTQPWKYRIEARNPETPAGWLSAGAPQALCCRDSDVGRGGIAIMRHEGGMLSRALGSAVHCSSRLRACAQPVTGQIAYGAAEFSAASSPSCSQSGSAQAAKIAGRLSTLRSGFS
jgi:hypothetical protein